MHTQPKPGIAYPKTSSLLLLQFFSLSRSRSRGGRRNGVCALDTEARRQIPESRHSTRKSPGAPRGARPLPSPSGSERAAPRAAGGEGWAAHPLYLIMHSFIVSYAN